VLLLFFIFNHCWHLGTCTTSPILGGWQVVPAPALQVVEVPSPLALPGRAAQSPCIERNRTPSRWSLVFWWKMDKVS